MIILWVPSYYGYKAINQVRQLAGMAGMGSQQQQQQQQQNNNKGEGKKKEAKRIIINLVDICYTPL